MAKEYIEREAAKRELLSWAVCMNHPEYLMKDDALHIIDSMPAADVVEQEQESKLLNGWISVQDRLPDNKEHDWVLAQVVEDNGYMHIPKVMEYRQLRNDWFEETYGWLSEYNGVFTVTHWMPLPLAPEVKND